MRNDQQPVRSHSRARRYRLPIAMSHRLTWWMGKHLSNMVPIQYVTGYPKSGTTWVARMLADYLQLPLPERSVLPIGCAAVLHGHREVRSPKATGLYVLRDGRDALLSLYFHFARQIQLGDFPRMTGWQSRLFPGLVNKQHVRANLPAFMARQFKRPVASSGLTWAEHIQWFFNSRHPGLVMVRYEQLLEDPHAVLGTSIERLTGQPVDTHRLGRVIEKFSFKNQTGREPGQEDRDSPLRNGRQGDWRNYFTREAAEIFARHCGDALIEAGYEQNSSWLSEYNDRFAAAG